MAIPTQDVQFQVLICGDMYIRAMLNEFSSLNIHDIHMCASIHTYMYMNIHVTKLIKDENMNWGGKHRKNLRRGEGQG